jgi:hypothetical protein
MAMSGIHHALDPSQDEKFEHAEMVGRDRAQVANLTKMRGEELEEEGARAANRQRNNLADYTAIRPELEREKVENKRFYDEWRMEFGDRKQDSAEDYIKWRMANGDRRATTSEGQLELRREWLDMQGDQFDRRMDETERHNTVTERQGGERIGISREMLKQGWTRIDQGRERVDQGWGRIEQNYDRLDEGRRKQVDALAAKAATAEAEAEYFEKSQKPNNAALKRREASEHRKQAEAIAARPAQRSVQRPPTTTRQGNDPPISEEEFVNRARQSVPNFDEAKARETYRRRYGL